MRKSTNLLHESRGLEAPNYGVFSGSVLDVEMKPQAVVAGTSFLCNLADREKSAKIHEAIVLARVEHLLFACSPLTIIWFVVTVVVDAFNFVFRRGLTHISEKSRKVMFPFFADSNSTPAVMMKVSLSRVVTPGFHVRPRTVRACAVPTMGYSGFSLKAPTTSNAPMKKLSGIHKFFITTFTCTAPQNTTVFSPPIFKYSKTEKFVAHKVVHNIHYNLTNPTSQDKNLVDCTFYAQVN